MAITANDLLMGSGTKSAAFPEVGATITGRITLEPKAAQQTDVNTNEPKFFKNGDPMMQVIVQLATDQRDPSLEDDDGVRSLYVKSNMLKAIREAVKASGAKGLEVGGTLTVTYIADGEKTNKAFNAPKLYTAVYKAPTGQAANSLIMGDQPPAGLAPPGIDPDVWARLDATQKAAVLAASPTSQTPPF